MFNQKVKFTILQIDNKINIDNINNELKKIFVLLNNTQKNIMTSDIMQRISVYKLKIELSSSKENWIN